MAQGFLAQGSTPVTSVARPTEPTIGTATTSANTTDAVLTFTPSVYGAAATSYVITKTSATTGAVTGTTQTTTASPVTVTGLSGTSSYTFTVRPQNANGLGSRSSGSTAAVTTPTVYSLALTATNTQSYSIPTGYTRMAAFVIGGGGAGDPAYNQASGTINLTNFRIGRDTRDPLALGSDGYFKGSIYGLLNYSRILTANEIDAIYNYQKTLQNF